MTTALAEKALWLRCASLTVTPAHGAAKKKYTGLRFEFDIQKQLTGEPNSATIRITNLSEASRKGIRDKETEVVLEAGYDDTVSIVYQGEVIHASHSHDGPEWLSDLECKTKLRALRDTRINMTFKAGSTKASVVRGIIGKLPGISIGKVDADGLKMTLRSHRSVSGTARKILDSLAKDWDFAYSINDGSATAVQLGKQAASRKKIRVAVGTGLLGSPRWTDEGLEVRSLLIPGLQPGDCIEVDSTTAKGTFQVTALHHWGDTHGEAWYTEATCREAKR